MDNRDLNTTRIWWDLHKTMQYEEIDPWEVVKNAIENNVPNPVAQSMTLMIIDLAHWLSHTFHK
jgi:hypothetical protein